MAESVGAGIWHNDCVAATLVPWFPAYAQSFGMSAPAQHGWIYVDKYGNRFMNEPTLNRTNAYLNLSDFNLSVPEYTRIPSFIIFDETCRKAGAISSGSSGSLPAYFDARPTWSSDNSVEISNGWILKAQDIPTLAATINSTTFVSLPPGTNNTALPGEITVSMSATNLANTVNTYNGYCTAKVARPYRDATVLRHGPVAGRGGRIRGSHPQRAGAGVRSKIRADSETLQRGRARLNQGLRPRYRLTQRRTNRVRADFRSQRGDRKPVDIVDLQ
jgi:hypothetical protein